VPYDREKYIIIKKKYLEKWLKLGKVRYYTKTPETLREASFDFTNFYKNYKFIDSN
jgi:hypothetical protein